LASEGTVLYRRSALGDVVLLGAVTSRVPKPVTVVTSPQWAPVAARLRGVDRVVPWPKGTPDPLPEGQLVDLQGTWKPADRRIDKRSLRRRLRLWFGIGAPRPTVVQLYAEACGVEPDPGPWIDVQGPRDRVVLAPGAAWATKRWAPERFAAVGRELGSPVTVIGGPGEEDLCQRVADGIPGAEVLCERGFDRTIEVLGRARLVVANDSGLMHLAKACGAPVVAIFGSTHPSDGFWSGPGEVVQRELRCRPCTLHGRAACPLGDAACLDLPASDVIAAARRVMA
jgi:ADP-heptose:LPS heptosyltransferase